MKSERFALTGARILTMTGINYQCGVILVENGKIKDVGNLAEISQGLKTIDLDGKTIMPGLVEAHSHLGIKEEIFQSEGDDVNETSSPATPQLRAIDAVNPFDLGFCDAREAGVTAAYIGPGSANVIGGLGLTVKTYGRVIDKMVLREPAGLKVAFGENPKRVYGEKSKMPVTRMGIAAVLRDNLFLAREYLRVPPAQKDLKLEVLKSVLKGEIPVRAHAHRADDILTALRIAREFDLKLVIEHATEGHLVAEEIAAAGVPAVVGPTMLSRAKVELKEKSFKTIIKLFEAGVKVAITTDHPEVPISYLSVCAALAVREGLPEEEALRAITINAAEILGVKERVGSIEPGKDADLLVLSGDPLDFRTKVEQVFCDGREVYRFKQKKS